MESSCRISAKVATMMTRNVRTVEGQQRSKRPRGIIVGSAAWILLSLTWKIKVIGCAETRGEFLVTRDRGFDLRRV